MLTYAIPHPAVQARIQLTHAHLALAGIALAGIAAAGTLMREVDELLKRRPGLGTLASEAEALRARLSRQRGLIVSGASSLTAAELRLLPLLSTHQSLPEIAAEMFLSPHTVKSHAKSIYRKPGASSRGNGRFPIIRVIELAPSGDAGPPGWGLASAREGRWLTVREAT